VNGVAIADPYANAITRFGGYRGPFRIASGQRIAQPFHWDNEVPSGDTQQLLARDRAAQANSHPKRRMRWKLLQAPWVSLTERIIFDGCAAAGGTGVQ